METSGSIPRKIPLILCLGSVLLCLVYDFLRPGLPPWWRQAGGGIPYVLFWILLWASALPNRRFILPICISVPVLTCALEFLQLWHPDFLVRVRQTRLGAAWLGNRFSWEDIPPYFIGGVIGFILLHLVFTIFRRRNHRNPT